MQLQGSQGSSRDVRECRDLGPAVPVEVGSAKDDAVRVRDTDMAR
jgi:hypothetical protein